MKETETLLTPDALYPCKYCRDEYSWPADDLYWSEKSKAWVCSNCWDDEHDGENRGIRLDEHMKGRAERELTSANTARIEAEAKIAEMRKAIEAVTDEDTAAEIICADWKTMSYQKGDRVHKQLLQALSAVPTKADGAGAAPPQGESGEEYYCKRDDFVRYIEDEVNPAREDAGLTPLDMKTAEECFRILNDFARKWGCKPTTEAASKDKAICSECLGTKEDVSGAPCSNPKCHLS